VERHCVWSRNLANEEAKARYRAVKIHPQWVVTPKKKKVFISTVMSISLTKEDYCEVGVFCIYDSVECIGGNQGTVYLYEGWNFNSGNYLFTTDTK